MVYWLLNYFLTGISNENGKMVDLSIEVFNIVNINLMKR